MEPHPAATAPHADALLRDVEIVQSLPQVPLILDICRRTTGMGFTAIARVTDDRWITCAALDELGFGLKAGDELRIETTLCDEVRRVAEAIVIEDVLAHPTYCTHPTPRMYRIRSYISVPIFRTDGRFFGTLCAFDPEPRTIDTPEIVGMFRLFGELVARTFDQEEALLDERSTARLREEFIAVVGHDLRSPLAAVMAGLHTLKRTDLGSETSQVVRLMQDATRRMDGIIGNLLDFARGRLGGGIELAPVEDVDLATLFESIVAEVGAVSDQPIEARLDLPARTYCDQTRIGQLLSNLLTNAVSHGARDRPVLVEAHWAAPWLTVSVLNYGDPIPSEIQPLLFQPFERGAYTCSGGGLGLGLHIASEIARAHGGRIELASGEGATRFTAALRLEGDPDT